MGEGDETVEAPALFTVGVAGEEAELRLGKDLLVDKGRGREPSNPLTRSLPLCADTANSGAVVWVCREAVLLLWWA